MKTVAKIVSACGLLLSVVPAFLVLYNKLTWDNHAKFMFIGFILWFAAAPFWMKSKTI